jgi:hypothetical protein
MLLVDAPDVQQPLRSPQAAADREPIDSVILMIAIGTAATAAAPLLHALSPILAIAVQALLALSIILVIPGHGPLIAIFILMFQNLFVSLFSSLVTEPSQLEFIKGYNFLSCAVMWLTTFALYLLGQRNRSRSVNRLMLGSTAVLAVVSLYFLIGLVQDGRSAAIYLRNIVLPVFLFQFALLTAASFRIRATPYLVTMGALYLLCGFIEFAFRDLWLTITNGYAYWGLEAIKATNSGAWEREMRSTGHVIVDLKDRFQVDFFNTPLLEGLGLSKVLRLFGPNISAVSYAYGVGFFALFLLSAGRVLLGAAALVLAVLCGIKGAMIMVIFVGFALLATPLVGAVSTFVGAVLVLAAYASFAIYTGLQIGDYHVIGLMGGWNGFLNAPLGRGLGVGGNFADDFSSIDWSAAQQAGAVDGAVESAVGVLMYQMGIAALVPLAFYFSIAIKTWLLYARSGLPTQGMAAFGILVVLVNGLFQEEALFAPPAIGFLICLAGLVLGNHIRETESATS